MYTRLFIPPSNISLEFLGSQTLCLVAGETYLPAEAVEAKCKEPVLDVWTDNR